MNEERMLILGLVEGGKISVDEAAKLFEALKSTRSCGTTCFDFDFTDKIRSFGNITEAFAKELCEKMNKLARDVKPCVKNATRVIIAKTAHVVDELGKSLNICLTGLTDSDLKDIVSGQVTGRNVDSFETVEGENNENRCNKE